MKSVLITGGDGLLGRALVESLRGDWGVHALVHTPPKDPVPGVDYRVVDLSSDWDRSALPERFDALVHLAQSSHFREFPERADDVFRVNIAATARLLEYARTAGAQQFLYTSSGGIYGSGAAAFPEDSPPIAPGQLGFYLGSKLCSEVLAQNYAQFFTVTIFRVFFMYGARQKRAMLMPRLVDSVREGREITLQGPEGLRINPIHVSDAAAAAGAALDAGIGGVYNIAGPDTLSLRGIAETIGRHVGRPPVFRTADGAPNDLIGDITAMRRDLQAPRITVEAGIGDLA